MGICDVGVRGIIGGGLMSCCMLGGKWVFGHWDMDTGGVWAMWGWGDISPWAAGEGVV